MIRATDETFPFICMQAVGVCTAEQIAGVKPLYARAFSKGAKHVSISDARRSDHSASQRKIWADWTNESMASARQYTLGTILILDSTILRGALTALNWIATPKIPQHVVGSTAEAVSMARALASTHGLDATPQTFATIGTWLDEGRRQAVG